MARQKIWREDWHETRLPHDPKLWRRHSVSGEFVYFSQYSAKSMRKWIALRGHAYDLLLFNGQRVTVRPKR